MRKERAFKALVKANAFLKEKGYNVFAIIVQGSQNYELDLYEEDYQSDFDCKAFVLPSFEDVYKENKVSKVYRVGCGETGLEQIEVKDLRLLGELVGKGNPSYLELLKTDYVLTNYKVEFQKLQALLPKLLKTRFSLFARATYGMATEKEKALCHPYPATLDKIEKFGYDPKQLHHIVRLRMLLEDTIEASELQLVPKEKEYLLDLKKGVLTLEQAKELASKEVARLKELKTQFENWVVTGEVLYEVDELVKAAVKSAIAAEFRFKSEGISAVGYKAPLMSLPAPVRQFVKENHPEIEEKHLVEVLEIKQYQLFNYWEK